MPQRGSVHRLGEQSYTPGWESDRTRKMPSLTSEYVLELRAILREDILQGARAEFGMDGVDRSLETRLRLDPGPTPTAASNSYLTPGFEYPDRPSGLTASGSIIG